MTSLDVLLLGGTGTIGRTTARALVDVDEYAVAELLRGPHPAAIAHELDVTIHVIRDWTAMQAARVAA